jgi:hypothetical protein
LERRWRGGCVGFKWITLWIGSGSSSVDMRIGGGGGSSSVGRGGVEQRTPASATKSTRRSVLSGHLLF